ncbi:uncharacterized protein TNCV_2704241 [Trichonephila clavipes]|nr:uncharacterized protein TNCV_2704241 [Trichonephila clavipes]
MENKFKSDVELEREYTNFKEEYEKLGHMLPNKELDGRITYFLLHHAVRRKDSITTKLRVVFDGSCKPPNSNSLNSVLGVGQILQPDIFTLLLLHRKSPMWPCIVIHKNEFWANGTSEQTHMGKKYLLTIAIPGYRPFIKNVELSSPVQHNASPDKSFRTTVMVSFFNVTGIKPCPDLSQNQNSMRIASGTEATLIRKEDTTPLICCPVFVLSASL